MVTSDALRQAVNEPSVAEQLQSLLPETGEDPVAIVSSPQFQQVKRVMPCIWPFSCIVNRNSHYLPYYENTIHLCRRSVHLVRHYSQDNWDL